MISFVFFERSRYHQDLHVLTHSFPTRRLSDLYRDRTGIASLKIRHNGVLGYHVEVPAKHADALMAPESGFTHRQTLAGVVRFNSADLHEAASRVRSEEHTSELQSLMRISYAVFCLKKKHQY